MLVLGEYVLLLFTKKSEIVVIGLEYLRIEAFTLFAYTFLHIPGSVLQGLKKPNISTFINVFGRCLPIPILYILIYLLDFGSQAIWWTIFGNSWLMAILFIIFTKREMSKAFPKDSEII